MQEDFAPSPWVVPGSLRQILKAWPVTFAETIRQQVFDRLPHEFITSVAIKKLDLNIQLEDGASFVHDDDAVGGQTRRQRTSAYRAKTTQFWSCLPHA